MWSAILLLVASATAVEQDGIPEAASVSPSATSLLQTAVSIQQSVPSSDSPKGADNGVGSKHSFQQCLNVYADEVGKVDSRLGAVVRAHPGTVVATSNRTVALGVGQGDTATRSLTKALMDLGLSVSHRMRSSPSYCEWACKDWIAPSANCPQGSFPDLDESLCRAAYRNFDYTTLPDDVDVAIDTPLPEIFINLFLSFPNAKWILTVRPADDWSLKRRKVALLPVQEPCGSDTIDKHNEEERAHLFNVYNELVRCMVPPDKLFEINVWNSTDGVVYNLAKFLKVEAPPPNTPLLDISNDMDDDWSDLCPAFMPYK